MAPSLYQRMTHQVVTWWRAVVSGVAALTTRPPRAIEGGGMSGRRVIAAPTGEADLRAIATSPLVFAAATRQALSMTTYPIRVYGGWAIGDRHLEVLSPTVPWVGSFLRLLATPDPGSGGHLFPEPGEALIAQVFADLRLCGVFVVVPTLSDDDIVGLTRLHPQCCTLEYPAGGQEEVVYRQGAEIRRYPRRSVCIGHLLSWARDGRSELGVGAGAALGPLVAAEAEALRQTAVAVKRDAANLRITAKTPAAAAYLQVKENRDKVIAEATTALQGGPGGDRFVYVVGGEYDITDSGMKPADLRAPEMLEAARGAELMALGVTPVSVGADGGSYATAVQQTTTQAETDEGMAGVVEAFLLRPLARHFASRSGGRWARRTDEITARIDLSTHPGYRHLRTDAIKRAAMLKDMGWTNTQAAVAEGLDDLPTPEGTPTPSVAPATAPGPEPGQPQDAPRLPVGGETGGIAGGGGRFARPRGNFGPLAAK